ncbi:toxin-antitoxin system HicB family antitoxin [Bradyrhizobium diazoefficiens]|uniref:toxin-antitoxin system HicB family antitoxin n=1 Tax=Bradyrhizobium diazoefficiens TaxID=1355477 RepID=UPI00272B76F0|nr:toxin-antitoxin system HicB family antitoxin [Bradyrhizobium diazoefficiens]WLA62382.1 toxin-antitoxin system HicB family antitoxin [Bradyrhizobium diazoefficiens]
MIARTRPIHRQEMATDKIQIGLRVPDELHEALYAAAKRRGVSVNKEITDRLLKTFDEDLVMSTGQESSAFYAVLRVAAAAMHLAGLNTAAITSALVNPDALKTWMEYPFAYDQAVKAAATVFEALRPSGEITAPPATADFAKLIGVGVANSILEEAASGEARNNNPGSIARAKKLNRDLGPLANRIQHFNHLKPRKGRKR